MRAIDRRRAEGVAQVAEAQRPQAGGIAALPDARERLSTSATRGTARC